jgi:hypothetical protein
MSGNLIDPMLVSRKLASLIGSTERVFRAKSFLDLQRFQYLLAEEARRIVDHELVANTPVYEYEPGTWGPREVERVTPMGGWHNPTVRG